MLDDFSFDADRPMTGLEMELNLIDEKAAEPSMRNAKSWPTSTTRSSSPNWDSSTWN